jgi:hypothetical protein
MFLEEKWPNTLNCPLINLHPSPTIYVSEVSKSNFPADRHLCVCMSVTTTVLLNTLLIVFRRCNVTEV